jgi:hypothetical protein
MVIPRADISLNNCFTAAEISLSPGAITAHSKFSLNSPGADLPLAEMARC